MSKLWLTTLILTLYIVSFAQNIIPNGNMESETGWTVYNMGSTNPANFEFNYTKSGPSNGSDGCLRVTSNKSTNILFWQQITLVAGKTYELEAAVKTSYVESFWLEFYLSTIMPQANQDYSPNGNADVELGLSTWEGCGPNLDGWMSEVACVDDGIYTPTGIAGENVTIYFGIKTGIMHDMDTIEVLVDSVVLRLVEDWYLLGSEDGILDNENYKITNVTPSLTIEDFYHGLSASPSASITVIGKNSGNVIPDTSGISVSDTILIRVSGNNLQDYSVETRPFATGNDIISILGGSIIEADTAVENLPNNAKIFQLKGSILVSEYATFEVVSKTAQDINNDDLISDDLQIIVTAENGDTKTYSLALGGTGITVMEISDSTGTIQNLDDYIYNLSGSISWHLTDQNRPFKGAVLNIKSEDVWMYFEKIRPSVFAEKFLNHILIDSSEAVIDENIRVVQYVEGTVVISHGSGYMPMEVYAEDGLSGSSMKHGLYTFYKNAMLGDMNDAIKSFRLKKGYMATLARDEKGTGYSRVYIADTGDVIVDTLPEGLHGEVSFIRVFPWRWVSKKAWRGSPSDGDRFGATSFYDYNNAASSTLDAEYVPMRHNPGWNAFSNINAQTNCTHALGYNEPDNEVDDGFSTVQGAIEMWPNLLESGLRLGSPATTDGGLNWLYDFLERCDALNYRVDFVAWHFYRAGYTAQGFYNTLKDIHERTGRPIWLTEWNNGCNWTYNGNVPTYEENGKVIDAFTAMLDSASFVERYFVWDGCNDELRMIKWETGELTQAGEAYRDQVSTMAFSHENEFYNEYIPFPDKATNPVPENNSSSIEKGIVLSWTPGELAITHRIYLGKSTTSMQFKKSVTDSVFDPGILEPNSFYFWRIDEVYNGRVTKGDTWRFRTGDYVEIDHNRFLESIHVYPQPANDILYINGLIKPMDITITNMMGQTIVQSINNPGIIDISSLSKGLYIIQIGNIKSLKFIKK